MANIIDGLRKARRHEIIELISLIETYTLSKKTLVSIHKLKTLIQKLLHKNGTVTGMQEEYESIQDKLILLNDSMLQNRFKKIYSEKSELLANFAVEVMMTSYLFLY